MAPSRISVLSEAVGNPLTKLSPVYDLFSNATKIHASKTAIACVYQDSYFLSSLSGTTDGTRSKYLRRTFDGLSRAGHEMALALAANSVRSGQVIAAYVHCGICGCAKSCFVHEPKQSCRRYGRPGKDAIPGMEYGIR